MLPKRRLVAALCRRCDLRVLMFVSLAGAKSFAGSQFALERYNPTNPGEASFWVDNPEAQTFSQRLHVGLDVDYAHNPLVVRQTSGAEAGLSSPVIAHQCVGHVQGAYSFAQRVVVGLDAPLVLVNKSTHVFSVAPGQAFSVGDLRLGALVRLWGGQDGALFGLYASAQIFAPMAGGVVSGDRLPRFVPKLIVRGELSEHLAYAATLAGVVRQRTFIGALPPMAGNTVASELQLGLNLAYVHRDFGLRIGPEILAATALGRGLSFAHDGGSIEILGAVHLAPWRHWRVGLAAGGALFGAAGTPNLRALARISWQPWDSDDAASSAGMSRTAEPAADVEPPPVAAPYVPEQRIDPSALNLSTTLQPPVEPAPDAKILPAAELSEQTPTPQIVIAAAQIKTPVLSFESNKAQLLASSLPIVEALVATLAAHPELKRIVIEGHTDNSGRRQANKLLSQRRAQTVMQALIAGGIAPKRLQARGMGGDKPRVKNDSAAHKAINRRVVFRISR